MTRTPESEDKAVQEFVGAVRFVGRAERSSAHARVALRSSVQHVESRGMEASIRIALAVAENEVRSRLRALLHADPTAHVVGDARDGLEAVRVARELSPDVLISLRLPRIAKSHRWNRG